MSGGPHAPVQALPAATEELILAWFLRLLALLFLAKGVLAWASVLGVPEFEPLTAQPAARQVLTVYLAVVAVMAGVGLWLGASWGTVIWLMTAMSEIVAFAAFRDLFGENWLLVAFHLGAMMLYVAIAWRIASIVEE